MKKQLFLYLLFVFLSISVFAQKANQITEGEVSYITSSSVYVRFESTDFLSVGDTLFADKEGRLLPALVIKNLSSLSVVGQPLSNDLTFTVGDKITGITKLKEKVAEELAEADVVSAENQESISPAEGQLAEEYSIAPDNKDSSALSKPQPNISGRFRIASYTDFSNTDGGNNQKMRYSYSMDARNLADGKLSLETYINFSHRSGQWDRIKQNIFNGLKIYDLSAIYKFSEQFKLSFGRKINPKLSSVGAIDGLQAEVQTGAFTIGAIAGSRPDYNDYSINTSLGQYGGYMSHLLSGKNGNMQTTISVIEQRNSSQTDRRFLYFQHANSLLPKLYFFGSAELELYKKNLDGVSNNRSPLTNMYLILRYKFSRVLTAGLSFSSRNNIIYYETYKDIVERLLEREMLQGYNLRLTIRPIKLLTVGINAGYRSRKTDVRPSRNLYSYVSLARISGTQLSASLSHTYIENSYLKGNIFSGMVYHYFVGGKLSTGIGYRYVNQSYFDMLSKLKQHLGEINVSYQITRKLSAGLYYEGTFETENIYHRIYINLSQRF